MNIPKIVIAGTHSGCGKTTITTAIMSVLSNKGYNICPFKVGPDYIDPMFHLFVTGNSSGNLDSWIMDDNTVIKLFSKNLKLGDIAGVEGVMGLYDGYGGDTDIASTAYISKLIDAPVILVVNGEGISYSIVALISGYLSFRKNIRIKGVIINNIKNKSHYILLKDILKNNLGVEVLGYLPKLPECSLKSRHLGLMTTDEIRDLKEKMDTIAYHAKQTINFDLLYKISNDNTNNNLEGFYSIDRDEKKFDLDKIIIKRKVKIGIAKDKAFNFYYRDNFDLLKELGVELEFFSPLNDDKLPNGLDGLIFGGGYPEEFSYELYQNFSIRKDIKRAIYSGMPTYAECGGFMYMTKSIENLNGQAYDMVGAIDGTAKMTNSLKRFGYVDIEMLENNILANKGEQIRAHEFHYSESFIKENIPHSYSVSKKRSGETKKWNCGFFSNNFLAAYPHIHFWGNTNFAKRFVLNCANYIQGCTR